MKETTNERHGFKMYLYIGEKKTIPICDVVAIFNAKLLRSNRSIRDFVQRIEQEQRFIQNGDKIVSYIVSCDEKGEEWVYGSPISSLTLRKRSQRALKSINKQDVARS